MVVVMEVEVMVRVLRYKKVPQHLQRLFHGILVFVLEGPGEPSEHQADQTREVAAVTVDWLVLSCVGRETRADNTTAWLRLVQLQPRLQQQHWSISTNTERS